MVVNSWKGLMAYRYLGLGLSLAGLLLMGSLGGRRAAIALFAADEDGASRRLAPGVVQLNTATASGASVVLNDTAAPVPWQRRGDRIGLADIPLMARLGIDLQDTNSAVEQPVAWFTEQPQLLPSWHANGYRFLDITDWATQQGWRLQARGNRLQIQTPAATVLAGRRGQHAWGDRLVLEVNRPTPWILEEGNRSFTLLLQADQASTFDPGALMTAGRALQSLDITTLDTGKIQLRGTLTSGFRPRVWSVPGPNRIILDLTQQPVPRDIQWAPGLRWVTTYVTAGATPFPVHQLRVTLGKPSLALAPIWPGRERVPGIAPLATTAKSWGAAAAINGGFFNRNNQLPLGAIRQDGRWISGPILNRGAIAWHPAGRFLIDRLALSEGLTTVRNDTFAIGQLNSGYVQAGMGRYTTAWGRAYTPVVDNEILVSVHQGRVIRQVQAGAAGMGRYPIPGGGYLLALRAYATGARSLPPGTGLTLISQAQPERFEAFPNVMGGGPLLVRQGQTVVNAQAEGFSDAFATQAAPRSVAGVTADNTLLLVAIHRSPGGRGPTLREAAEIMVQLGAQEALNLDGGNSASLYLGGSLINRHGSTVGRVHSGLGVFFPQND